MAKLSKEGRRASLVTIFIGILAALMSTIIFFIDLGLVLTVRNKVKNATNGDLQLNWGNAVCLLHQV